MKRGGRTKASVLAAALTALPACGARSASPSCTGEPFLKFRAAAEKATEVKPLLPLLSAAHRKLVEGEDEFTLEFLKQASDKKDAKVQQAAVQDGRCVVNVTAVDADGKPRKGTYMFELEDGEWRLVSFGWPE
jgi:hypothetical protein